MPLDHPPLHRSRKRSTHEPGSDWLRALSFTRGLGLAVLILGGVGVVALAVGSLFPDRTDDDGPS